MPLGTPYLPETVPVQINGAESSQSVAQMTALFGAGNIRTATKTFSFHYRGHTVQFHKGVPVVVDAGLAAALTAASAPVA